MTLERFRLAAALPPEGAWRLELVLDVSVAPPQQVVLARVPAAVAGDALALTALMREVERAVRVVHPVLLPVRGLADAGGLAVLLAWREGEPLRALLEASGALPPPLAARVLSEVAGALQAIHAAGAVHGDVRPERVLVAEDGAVLLTGLGRCTGPGATASSDLQALARLASDCLGPAEGEVAAALALAAAAGPAASDVAEALRRCGVAPASAAELAARLEAALPADGPTRSARRLALTMARRSAAPASPAAERPALSPPPLPSGPRAVPSSLPPPAPPAAGGPRTASARPEGGPAPAAAPAAQPPAGGDGSRRPSTGPAPALAPAMFQDPRLALLVGGGMALLGLVAGYLIGR